MNEVNAVDRFPQQEPPGVAATSLTQRILGFRRAAAKPLPLRPTMRGQFGYVLCQLTLAERNPNPEGGGLDAMHANLSKSSSPRPETWPGLRVGQRVRIETGALAGLSGTVLEFRHPTRVLLAVGLVSRSIQVEVDRSQVRPEPGPQHALRPVLVPALPRS